MGASTIPLVTQSAASCGMQLIRKCTRAAHWQVGLLERAGGREQAASSKGVGDDRGSTGQRAEGEGMGAEGWGERAEGRARGLGGWGLGQGESFIATYRPSWIKPSNNVSMGTFKSTKEKLALAY